MNSDAVVKVIEVVAILIIADTITALLANIKTHTLKSSVGRLGLSQKMTELILMIAFYFCIHLDPVHFNPAILTGLYSFFALFEIMSIVENAQIMGFDLTFLTKFFNDKK